MSKYSRTVADLRKVTIQTLSGASANSTVTATPYPLQQYVRVELCPLHANCYTQLTGMRLKMRTSLLSQQPLLGKAAGNTTRRVLHSQTGICSSWQSVPICSVKQISCRVRSLVTSRSCTAFPAQRIAGRRRLISTSSPTTIKHSKGIGSCM